MTTASTKVAIKIADFDDTFVVGGADFSADGSTLATSGQVADPEVHIWDWRAQRRRNTLRLPRVAGEGSAIRYSPDGALLAAGQSTGVGEHPDGVIQIWNANTGAAIHDVEMGGGGSLALHFEFTPDGKFLVATDEFAGLQRNSIQVFKTDTWKLAEGINTSTFKPRALAISPDGELLAVGGTVTSTGVLPLTQHSGLLMVSLGSGRVVRTIEAAFPDQNVVQSLAWSPDGKSLAAGALVTGSSPGPDAVRIFNPASGQRLLSEPASEAGVYGLSYSQNGRYLIEGYIDGDIKIWDGEHKTLLQSIPTNIHFHTVVRISRDSRYFVIAAGKHIAIW